jgi:hypothetical protein
VTVAALVLVGTPIGNLGDLSPRAVQELGRNAASGRRGQFEEAGPVVGPGLKF